jgi:phosphatidylglycerophosphate synthase
MGSIISLFKAVGLVIIACVVWVLIPVLWALLATISAIAIAYMAMEEIRRGNKEKED